MVAACNFDKASYKIEGNLEDLQVGLNEFNVIVTAEDGTTNTYKVIVTREREGLKVNSINIFYIDEEGNTKSLLLNPEFQEDVFNYTLEDISYFINELNVEVISNLEQATIEIIGDKNLVEGKNLIKIIVTMPSENEELADEVLTYEISVNKEEKPTITLIGKIKNWFNGITGTINIWFEENSHNVLTYTVVFCSICMFALTIYFIIDYKKYKKLLEKISELTQYNNSELKTEENVVSGDDITENDMEKSTNSKGRHF